MFPDLRTSASLAAFGTVTLDLDLSPMIAAGAMALSSISVVIDAARLNGFTPPALAPDVPPTAGTATTARASARTGT